MWRPCVPVLVLLLCVGCGNAEQRRQAEREQQAAAVSNNLNKVGQDMHNQQDIDAAPSDSTPERPAASQQTNADVNADSSLPANE